VSKDGIIAQRLKGNALRLEKSAVFVMPWFPKNRLKPASVWTETVEWIDTFGDWKIRWQGQRRWRIQQFFSQGPSPTMQLAYEADLFPQILNRPAWLGTENLLLARVQGTGEALFDLRQRQLVSHSFSYATTLRVPIRDLSRIPDALRVGQRYFQVPGEIVLQLENKAAIQKQ
jgi:hypothetical protein